MKIYPPVYFFAATVLMAALHFYFPVIQWVEPPLSYVGGGGLLALGFSVVMALKKRFDAAGTTIKPFAESSALLTGGLYRFSRNPIYVCMVAGLIGVWAALGSLGPLIVIPVFFGILHSRVIPIEEAMLEDAFGDDYRNYKSGVRRWL